MNVVWATTFSADLYKETGHKLVESFLETKTEGTLAVFAEGMAAPEGPGIAGHSLDGDPFLAEFLANNRDVIPTELGGDLDPPECKCRKGPLQVHSKKHQLPCPGFWFCRNSFRWLRKVLSAKYAADLYADTCDVLIWVDSDAFFKQKVTHDIAAGWFPPKTGCIYTKNARTEIETGVVGYHRQNGGRKVLGTMLSRYQSGAYRKDIRWDDCHQLGKSLREVFKAKQIRSADLATKVGENNTVIQFSPLGPYLGHDKGHHRRTGTLK